MGKSPLQSKVLWFNTLSIIALAIADISSNNEIRNFIGNYYYLLMIVGALINAVLRFYTVKPVSIKKPKDKNPLNTINEANQADDNYLKDF